MAEIDARILLGAQSPDIIGQLTRGTELASQMRNAPILDRLLQQRAAQGDQTAQINEQTINANEIARGEQAAGLLGAMGQAILDNFPDDLDRKRQFIEQNRPRMNQMGITDAEIDQFPIDDNTAIEALVLQRDALIQAGGSGFKATAAPYIVKRNGKTFSVQPGMTANGQFTTQEVEIEGDIGDRAGRTSTDRVTETGDTEAARQKAKTAALSDTQAVLLETEPEIAAKREAAVIASRDKAERLVDAPRVIEKIDAQNFRIRNVSDTLAEARALVGPETTGFIGGRLGKFEAGTAAFALAQKIKSIQGVLTIEELTAMRENSKTGGAVGNASDKDMDLLGSTVTSLSQALSPPELTKAFDKVERHFNRMLDHMAKKRSANVKLLGRDPSSPSDMTTEELIEAIKRRRAEDG